MTTKSKSVSMTTKSEPVSIATKSEAFQPEIRYNVKDSELLGNVALTLRLATKKDILQYFFCTALRSISLYWSKHLGKVALIMDQESPMDHYLAHSLKKYQPSINLEFQVYFEPLPQNTNILRKNYKIPIGYYRQIYSSFLMDLFIEAPVIAWIDTDTKILTPITPENIIINGRLKAKANHPEIRGNYFREWDKTTRQMIGKHPVGDFMSYFPVLIWKDTITNCRRYILHYMEVNSFEEAFDKTGPREMLSPVNTLMTYAYYFEKDRYDWHFDIKHHSLLNYNMLHIARGFRLRPSDLTPDMHLTHHEKYFTQNNKLFDKLALCRTMQEISGKQISERNLCQSASTSDKMSKSKENSFLKWMFFQFESIPNVKIEHVTTWCRGDNSSLCDSLIREHYQNVRHWIQGGFYNLDIARLAPIETLALDFNITCPSYLGFKYNL